MGISSIFKTLFKIPIIILISYAIFNAIAFGISYGNMLGLSYVVQQTALENNFIPSEERQSLENYMEGLETGVLDTVKFTDDTTFDKKQYGETVTAGVTAHYRFIWPLTPKEQINGEFTGMSDGRQAPTYLTEQELRETREELESNQQNNITIEYQMPGLKYYPDLED